MRKSSTAAVDAHVHVYAAGLNIVRVAQSPMSYLAHFAAQFLHTSLDRGFTTLRDVGGADIGLVLAIKRPCHLANRRPWRLPSRRPLA
jgi:imidazolonepropionase-like amidohydrolase